MSSFLERFGGTSLREIFADSALVSIYDKDHDWLALPPADFAAYAESVERAAYDPLPDNPAVFRPGATFLLAQLHRTWLTLQAIAPYLAADATLLDLGAYPFTIDFAIRDFLRSECRIIATFGQELPPALLQKLTEANVELWPVNLDPRVLVEHRLPGLSDYLPVPDNSVDVVLFAHVIEHLYHPIQIVKECFRVLKPGGKLIVTTDHAFLLGGFLNYLQGAEYLHEPVSGTSAMVFNEWRGHVRFFTEGDLRTLVESAGGVVLSAELREVLYNSIPERFFIEPQVSMPRWRAKLLSEVPMFRNEILLTAEKRDGGKQQVLNPLDTEANRTEFSQLASEFQNGNCDLRRSTSLDLAFACRLLLGRWPTEHEMEQYRINPPRRGLDAIVHHIIDTPEFAGRPIAVSLERPDLSCIVMTETASGLRYFFSAQDTFVGFPVAVGVFEPDVQGAMDRLIAPGMNCVDAGANFGFYSVRMAAAVARGGGRVFAFEPAPFNFALLKRNCAENGFEHAIVCHQVACGDEDGTAELYSDPNPANLGGAFVGDAANRVAQRHIGTVQICRLDSILPQDLPLHLVKIDVEGYECRVLSGLAASIQRWRPAIICEFNSYAAAATGEESARKLLDTLAEFGYAIYEAAAFARGHAVPFGYVGGAAYANLVCLPFGHPAASQES